jgi:hypothetical protein
VETERPTLAAAAKAAERPLPKLRAAHDQATETWRSAYAALDHTKADFAGRLHRLEDALLAACPQKTRRQFIDRLRDGYEQLRQQPLTIRDIPVEPEGWDIWGRRLHTRFTNRNAVEARLLAMNSLRQNIETRWHLEPWSDADWQSEFEKATAALPDETRLEKMGAHWK